MGELKVTRSQRDGRWYITYGGVRVGKASGYGTRGLAERAINGLVLWGR